jgi:hypothetical protein
VSAGPGGRAVGRAEARTNYATRPWNAAAAVSRYRLALFCGRTTDYRSTCSNRWVTRAENCAGHSGRRELGRRLSTLGMDFLTLVLNSSSCPYIMNVDSSSCPYIMNVPLHHELEQLSLQWTFCHYIMNSSSCPLDETFSPPWEIRPSAGNSRTGRSPFIQGSFLPA